mmetsp:Transcript_15607/g.36311  ORF Transcript_15607/g.36311 Transcript_15607/m.36311 type:complete len:267 (+) Transcript_15607:828-1628(+)
MGSFPPSSNTSRLRPGAHASISRFPVAEDPVIATMSTFELTSLAPTAPSPCARATTPGGRAEARARPTRPPVKGATSEGLMTTAFPAMSAGIVRSRISSAGKFHGASTTTTPSASRRTRLCASPAPPTTWGWLASTMASIKASLHTAPSASSAASDATLPISRVIVAASSCLASPSLASAALMSSARWAAVWPCSHPGWAARAAATMRSTSVSVVHLTRPITSPVAGSVSTMKPSTISTPWTIFKARRWTRGRPWIGAQKEASFCT